MKTLLRCTLLGVLLLCLTHHAVAQSKTPSPFPGWANKAPAGAAATDNKDLLGRWEGHLTDGDGSNPGQRRMNISLTITADKISAGGQGTVGDGTYKVSGGSAKLRHIDATGTSGQYAGKQYEGIFSLEGDTLKWCSGNPGKGRPKELRTNTGSGYFLMVLTRKQ